MFDETKFRELVLYLAKRGQKIRSGKISALARSYSFATSSLDMLNSDEARRAGDRPQALLGWLGAR